VFIITTSSRIDQTVKRLQIGSFCVIMNTKMTSVEAFFRAEAFTTATSPFPSALTPRTADLMRGVGGAHSLKRTAEGACFQQAHWDQAQPAG